MAKLTAIDLFSGCGGSALGFQKSGFDIRVAIDVDYWSTETYKRNHQNTVVLTDDIRYVSGEQLLKLACLKKRQLSVLLACPPCQGFSFARSNGSSYDPRNELVFEFVRLAKEMLPKIIAMENVPGLSRGKGKGIFLETVSQLNKIGYKTISGVLNASDYGVPQNRRRVILLGTRLNRVRLKLPVPTYGEKETKSKVTVRDAIKNLPIISWGKKDADDLMHVSANLSDINFKRMKTTPHNGGGWKDWPEDLKLDCHKKSNGGHGDVYGRMRWDEPSPTLTGGCTAISKGRFGHPEQNRAISLREASRLQSFPDTYIFEGPFTNIAKQIGNAVPPLLAQAIAETVKTALTEEKQMKRIYNQMVNNSQS